MSTIEWLIRHKWQLSFFLSGKGFVLQMIKDYGGMSEIRTFLNKDLDAMLNAAKTYAEKTDERKAMNGKAPKKASQRSN